MIFFRCDGNSVIGGGHVMRCLSIANALRDMGRDCSFILADDEFKEKIIGNGFKAVVLGTDCSDLEPELPLIYGIIGEGLSTIIVDTYFATRRYFEELNKIAKTVYLDDYCSQAFPVSLLINYNLYADYGEYESLYGKTNNSIPKLLLGPKYAPLREEFCNAPKRRNKTVVHDVLISSGISDSLHLVIGLINDLKKASSPYAFHFVVGEKNPDIYEIINEAGNLKNVFVYFKCGKISELMQKCDVAISAAGSTLYELCSFGVPIVSYAFADNQLEGLNEFQKQGLAISLGDIREKGLSISIIEKAIDHVLDLSYRESISRKMQEKVDGFGARRIANFVLELDKESPLVS